LRETENVVALASSQFPIGRMPMPRGNLFIFDEPTTGLHFDDVAMLLRLFQRLVDRGHSIVVIEHNLEVIKCADWIVDLGPEAGDAGGDVVAVGTPEQIAKIENSHTGKFLRQVLSKSRRALHVIPSREDGEKRQQLGLSAKGVYPRDIAANHQCMDVVRAFVCGDGFKIHEMTNHGVAICDASCAQYVASFARAFQRHPNIVAFG
jgi:ABC-type glutathione transport system ATPase component